MFLREREREIRGKETVYIRASQHSTRVVGEFEVASKAHKHLTHNRTRERNLKKEEQQLKSMLQ